MIASSFIKSAAVAAVVAFATPSFASTVIGMSPTTTGSAGIFGAIHGSGETSFTDDYTFSVGSVAGTVGASAIEFVISSSYLTLQTLTLNGQTVNFTYANGQYSASTMASAITDPQSLSITGLVNGGGSYGGQVTFTAGAVPEAATWGMMLVGFGAMGAALRSNRRREGALTA